MYVVCGNCGNIVKTYSKKGRVCPICNKFISIKKSIHSNYKLTRKEAKKMEYKTVDSA